MTDELEKMLRKIIAMEAEDVVESELLNTAYSGIKSAIEALEAYEDRRIAKEL